jgi:hypothetical protein
LSHPGFLALRTAARAGVAAIVLEFAVPVFDSPFARLAAPVAGLAVAAAGMAAVHAWCARRGIRAVAHAMVALHRGLGTALALVVLGTLWLAVYPSVSLRAPCVVPWTLAGFSALSVASLAFRGRWQPLRAIGPASVSTLVTCAAAVAMAAHYPGLGPGP